MMLVYVFAVHLCAPPALAQPKDMPDYLLDQARLRRQALTSVALSFTVTQEAPDDAPSELSEIQQIDRSILLDLASGRYIQERAISRADAEAPIPAHFSYDGSVESTFVADLNSGSLTAPTLTPLGEASAISIALLNPPGPGGLGMNDGSLESFLERGRLREELEEIDDSLCYVVDAFLGETHYATLWLDTHRDLLPVRRETFGADGRPSSSAVVRGAALFDNLSGPPVWLPTSITTMARIGGYELVSHIDVSVEDVEINPPVTDDSFRIDFPPGATVFNQFTGLTYEIDEDGIPVAVETGAIEPVALAEAPPVPAAKASEPTLPPPSATAPTVEPTSRPVPPQPPIRSRPEEARNRKPVTASAPAPSPASALPVAAEPPQQPGAIWWALPAMAAAAILALVALQRAAGGRR